MFDIIENLAFSYLTLARDRIKMKIHNTTKHPLRNHNRYLEMGSGYDNRLCRPRFQITTNGVIKRKFDTNTLTIEMLTHMNSEGDNYIPGEYQIKLYN